MLLHDIRCAHSSKLQPCQMYHIRLIWPLTIDCWLDIHLTKATVRSTRLSTPAPEGGSTIRTCNHIATSFTIFDDLFWCECCCVSSIFSAAFINALPVHFKTAIERFVTSSRTYSLIASLFKFS